MSSSARSTRGGGRLGEAALAADHPHAASREAGPARGRPAAVLRALAMPVVSLAALALLWQVAAWLAANPRLMPPPAAVFDFLWRSTASGEVPYHLGVTLWRTAAAFTLAMAIGVTVGLVMGRLALVDRLTHPWLVFFLNIPALVVIILAYIWIGLTEAAAITAVAVNKIPNVAVTVREGARALDRDLLEMADVFRLGPWRTLFHVVLPQLYPYLAAAARSGLALIWKIVLVVELLGRSQGVGFQLGLYFQLFDVTAILAYTLAFVLVVQVIEWTCMQPIEHRAGRWRR